MKPFLVYAAICICTYPYSVFGEEGASTEEKNNPPVLAEESARLEVRESPQIRQVLRQELQFPQNQKTLPNKLQMSTLQQRTNNLEYQKAGRPYMQKSSNEQSYSRSNNQDAMLNLEANQVQKNGMPNYLDANQMQRIGMPNYLDANQMQRIGMPTYLDANQMRGIGMPTYFEDRNFHRNGIPSYFNNYHPNSMTTNRVNNYDLDGMPTYLEGNSVYQSDMPSYLSGHNVYQNDMPSYLSGHNVYQHDRPSNFAGDNQNNLPSFYGVNNYEQDDMTHYKGSNYFRNPRLPSDSQQYSHVNDIKSRPISYASSFNFPYRRISQS